MRWDETRWNEMRQEKLGWDAIKSDTRYASIDEWWDVMKDEMRDERWDEMRWDKRWDERWVKRCEMISEMRQEMRWEKRWDGRWDEKLDEGWLMAQVAILKDFTFPPTRGVFSRVLRDSISHYDILSRNGTFARTTLFDTHFQYKYAFLSSPMHQNLSKVKSWTCFTN